MRPVERARARGRPSGRLLRIAAAVAMLAMSARPGVSDVIDRVMAIVNGRLITLSDVRTVRALDLIDVGAAKDSDAAVLDRLIERTLVLQEVERYAPPEPDPAEVAARLQAIEHGMGAGTQVPARLAALGVSEEWLRRWVRDDLRVQAYVDQRFAGSFEPTAEEIENYFRQHRDEFTRDGQTLPPADAQRLARERVMAIRRTQLVAEWLAGLRRRADITKPAARDQDPRTSNP